MNNFKLLIDTNVLIGLEDAQPVQASLAELVRVSAENGVALFVDGANYDDVERDKDSVRRGVTLSKLAKFPRLRGVPIPDDAQLVGRFGVISKENDRSDIRLLAAVDAKAVDFLVSQDNGLHKRAEKAGLTASVLTVEEALDWLRQTFAAKSVVLPYVVERKAYEIDTANSILDSLRSDYPGFDIWFDICRRQHRECWTLEIEGEIAGLVIRKDESHADAGTQGVGPKILKICTFKVRDEFQGEKFGELLLKQVLWFAQHNKYDLVYLTAFPKQGALIDLLGYYGFKKTKMRSNGEVMLEKTLLTGPLPALSESAFDFDRKHYPRYYDGPAIRKFCVPIRPDYHRRLFPEIAFETELPLFPSDMFGPMLGHGEARTPGNTIRKVYLCQSRVTRIRPGDLVYFYMSKDEQYAASQSITTVGVVEQVINVVTPDDLIKETAKRSVFSAEELEAMGPSNVSPVKLIDFLLVGHVKTPVTLEALLANGIFLNRPPQSISEFTDERYANLKRHFQLDIESW